MKTSGTSEDSLLQNEFVRLYEVSTGCYTVVIGNPPYNLVDSQVFAGLQAVKSFAEDPATDVRVIVFKSANRSSASTTLVWRSPITRDRSARCPNRWTS